jgi:hypothetical protein
MTTTTADPSPGGDALTHRFEQALIYACHVHGGQTRKGSGSPTSVTCWLWPPW